LTRGVAALYNYPMRCAGKKGVVTGSSRGLGREILLALCAEGAEVVGVARDAEAGSRAADEASAGEGRAVFAQGDVRNEQDIVDAIARFEEELGGFDFIVNNAGILGEGRLHETSNQEWDDLVATHLTGTFWGCKHAIATMRKNESGGSIVNLGSILSFTGDGYLAAYTAMKSGVLGLTKAIAIDYALDGIRCNCICPGDMETPMIQQYFDGTEDPVAARAEMEAAYPGKRIAHPREVATAAVYLVSDDSSFVNGTPILVDGGLTAKTY
jgi:NAD(P)-dependent dehydrogenase (short-subunit alcohol dehydrogenase family)